MRAPRCGTTAVVPRITQPANKPSGLRSEPPTYEPGPAASEGFFDRNRWRTANKTETSMTSAYPNLPEPHLLLGAALFLMTKHAQLRCPGICRAIAQHFKWLARHPAPKISAEQRRLYRQLAEQWAEMAAAANPRIAAPDTLPAPIGSYLQ
jgi:hypothetical protein